MSQAKNEMVINYVPGQECRVAVLEDGKLEEFHAERADAVSHVGNIYVGKVRNVEPAIQAAFVDFGLEQNGFLHVSDLHPQYFPGEDDETTELVGKKTPRRERPPIQECLRRGQEVAVQVLKEGVGTKGPTVTSYLSIPGRFLVMMPSMDRVGVSRKVEDEETRRKMREILDQLELPDGFGFIVRTAGMERTKAELKRDLAYLQRLWKDIEKRWSKGGNKPRLLYSESDLLMRALRDMVTTDLERIVIDDESAITRAARFLKIVAPRTTTKLIRYTGRTPIFHATGVEEQIRTMYSREVPLPSGGRLVIDETEALVAIDVNSGKMRDARDAETNAYRTNMEAAEEICRQLKLRDVGGIIINDLIDMRSMKHRREVEHKFKELLKKDRSRTTLAQISPFGILEMTRQRMRGSYESVHFADCPICRGRGLVQRPDSVATDAMRELAALLEYERITRIEMAVSPRIAGELLSSKRRSLNRLERVSGKHVDVRVSESVPVDRVTFYCYDDRGADIDTGRIALPRAKQDEMVVFELPSKADDDWAADPELEAKAALIPEPAELEPAHTAPETDAFLDTLEHDDLADSEAGAEQPSGESGEGRGRRRRRGRGRGRGGEPDANRSGGRGQQQQQQQQQGRRDQPPARPAEPRPVAPGVAAPGMPGAEGAGEEGGEGGRRRRRRRRRGRGRGGAGEAAGAAGATANGVPPREPLHEPGHEPRHEPDGTPIFDETEEAPPAPISLEPSSWDVDVPTAPASAAPRGGTHAMVPVGDYVEDEESSAESAEDTTPAAPPTKDAAPEPEGDGEGGERRGRRRRRRRRSGEGEPAGAPRSDAAPKAAPAARAPSNADEPRDDGAGDDASHDDAPAAPEGDSESGGAPGEGGERSGGRRRRRRRGRGRGGEAAGPEGRDGPPPKAQPTPEPRSEPRNAPKAGGSPRPQGGSPAGGRAPSGGGGQNNRGGEKRDGARPAQRPPQRDAAPVPEPKPTPTPAKAPRTLYSATRRKLLPSERAKLKPE